MKHCVSNLLSFCQHREARRGQGVGGGGLCLYRERSPECTEKKKKKDEVEIKMRLTQQCGLAGAEIKTAPRIPGEAFN